MWIRKLPLTFSECCRLCAFLCLIVTVLLLGQFSLPAAGAGRGDGQRGRGSLCGRAAPPRGPIAPSTAGTEEPQRCHRGPGAWAQLAWGVLRCCRRDWPGPARQRHSQGGFGCTSCSACLLCFWQSCEGAGGPAGIWASQAGEAGEPAGWLPCWDKPAPRGPGEILQRLWYLRGECHASSPGHGTEATACLCVFVPSIRGHSARKY